MQIGRWFLFLVPVSLAAQVVSVDLSPLIQEPGRGIALIQLRNLAGAKPAAVEWTIGLAGDAAHVQIEPAEQALAAKKRIDCARNKDQVTCILWGPNQSVIHDGILAKVVLSENAGGDAELRLSRISAVSADGSGIIVKGQPEASQAQEQTSEAHSFLLGWGGITLLVLAVLAAIYVTRSRLSAAR